MGSTSFLKPKSSFYKSKSGSSAGSDKEMNAKLKRTKIRRPTKMSDYGIKRIPDYTEMAYKEAVSKLKYFLSGNNPPSVSSYGSIKNLDESDGDLDKKYSSSYNSEFKARPRLTAKYATMYADSLTNFNPQPINTTNVSQEVSGGTNPDVVNFIQKQEEYIEQLERESQYCRDELNNLLGKVKEVISENEHLHEAQKNKIISRMFHSYNGSETDDLDDVDSTGLDSDCKISPSKTRKARSRSTKLEGPNIVFESRISELEAQLTQAKIDLKKMQDENNEYKRKLANGLVDSTCLDGFKRQIDNLQRDKTNLESQISKLKMNLDHKEDEFDSKYKKGSDIIEQQLREERKNLETEIRRLQEELSSERARSRSLAGEGARRAVADSAAEHRYRQLADQLQRDLAGRDDCVAKLQLDLERQRRDENDLKREISMKNTAVEELKMELKNKIASLQADLSQSHAEKAALEEELATARLAIERQQRQAKHETNRLNSEIQSVRQRLDRADADLVHSRRENLRLSEQISNLEKELNMRLLTPISPEKKGKDKELSTMLESMENKHAKTVAELETMIQSQNILMEKLTSECRSLTDKLDDSNRRHKLEKTQLLCRNSELMRKLRNLWSSHKKYCTTAIAPYRSYTPLSGYPSSSCYDLERTYMTPYRNRLRRSPASYNSDDIGLMSKNLSDLSINEHVDSDDDIKVNLYLCACVHLCVCYHVCVFREELATLQRQVEKLGRSMETPHQPSNHQAPSTHSPTATRISDRTTNSERQHTGSEPGGNASLGHNDDNSGNIDSNQHCDVEQEQTNGTDFQRALDSKILREETETKFIKQHSTDLIDNQIQPQITKDITQEDIRKDNEDNLREVHKEYEEEKQNIKEEKDYVQTETSERLEESDKNSKQEYPNYGRNYEEQYSEQQEYSEQPAYVEQQYTENTEYPTQEYSEQPEYTEQYENYEQYPQQYADPNTQYEAQEGFENYATEGNYSEQNYENQPASEVPIPQYPDTGTEPSESQENKINNEQLTNQS